MIRIFIFFFIVLVGWPIIWLFLRHAQKHERVSLFGFGQVTKRDDPEKFAKVVRSYKMQMAGLPAIAALIAIFMVIPE